MPLPTRVCRCCSLATILSDKFILPHSHRAMNRSSSRKDLRAERRAASPYSRGERTLRRPQSTSLLVSGKSCLARRLANV